MILSSSRVACRPLFMTGSRAVVVTLQSGDVTQAWNTKNQQTEWVAEVADRRNLIVRIVGNDAANDKSPVRQLSTDAVECLEERVGRLVSH
jgi:hypothetical protein